MKLIDVSVHEEQRNYRNFKSMVQAAGAAFLPLRMDEANYVATGLLESDNGNGYRALLSYEGQKQYVTIAVTLKPSGDLSTQQRDALEQVQCASEMCRFDPDRENRLLNLRASSVCSQPEQPAFTVKQIIQDLRRVLADDRLKVVLGD